jgi:phosphoserine phosphatase
MSENTLPSWFQESSTRLLKEEPGFVLFDADYTVWGSDIASESWDFCMAAQSFKKEAADAFKEELMGVGGLVRGEAHVDGAQLMELFSMGAVGSEALCTFMVTCFAGWTLEELEELGADMARKAFAGHLYKGMRPFMEGLSAHGHRIVVVTASAEWLVKGAIEELKLPVEKVIGFRSTVVDGTVGTRADTPLCYHDGKVDAFRKHYPDANVLGGFSDSHSDIALVELGSVVRGGINPSEKLEKHALEQGDPWIVIKPELTENGRSALRYPKSFEI